MTTDYQEILELQDQSLKALVRIERNTAVLGKIAHGKPVPVTAMRRGHIQAIEDRRVTNAAKIKSPISAKKEAGEKVKVPSASKSIITASSDIEPVANKPVETRIRDRRGRFVARNRVDEQASESHKSMGKIATMAEFAKYLGKEYTKDRKGTVLDVAGRATMGPLYNVAMDLKDRYDQFKDANENLKSKYRDFSEKKGIPVKSEKAEEKRHSEIIEALSALKTGPGSKSLKEKQNRKREKKIADTQPAISVPGKADSSGGLMEGLLGGLGGGSLLKMGGKIGPFLRGLLAVSGEVGLALAAIAATGVVAHSIFSNRDELYKDVKKNGIPELITDAWGNVTGIKKKITVPQADGTLQERSGGTPAWRNNNPGNIEYGAFARSQGAIDTDGRYAVFPSYEDGRNAVKNLLFSSNKYRDLTLSAAISRYAPKKDGNDTDAYQNYVLSTVGGQNKRMSRYSAAEQEQIVNAVEKYEGSHPGRVVTVDSVSNLRSGIAQPIPATPKFNSLPEKIKQPDTIPQVQGVKDLPSASQIEIPGMDKLISSISRMVDEPQKVSGVDQIRTEFNDTLLTMMAYDLA
jgi:hypothetical protein